MHLPTGLIFWVGVMHPADEVQLHILIGLVDPECAVWLLHRIRERHDAVQSFVMLQTHIILLTGKRMPPNIEMLPLIIVALVVILALIYIPRMLRSLKRELPAIDICTGTIEHKKDTEKAPEMPYEMVNTSVDRGIMRHSPQPDVARCYWGSTSSQDDVDDMNRLNVSDIVTPLVASKTNVVQGCVCRCGGDMIGKVNYD